MMAGEDSRSSDQRLQLLQEMRGQNFDMIRFASYRTACKLRFVQKRANCKYFQSGFRFCINVDLP